jgi:DNA-binding transcriptional MerR regulator
VGALRKSADAFRTISEVAEELDLPQHVLRFWETRFSQIKPMKRGGGRRYYRPDDVELLRGIRHLLYSEGYTIKGVQRILKDQGARHVIDLVAGGLPLDGQGKEDASEHQAVDQMLEAADQARASEGQAAPLSQAPAAQAKISHSPQAPVQAHPPHAHPSHVSVQAPAQADATQAVNTHPQHYPAPPTAPLSAPQALPSAVLPQPVASPLATQTFHAQQAPQPQPAPQHLHTPPTGQPVVAEQSMHPSAQPIQAAPVPMPPQMPQPPLAPHMQPPVVPPIVQDAVTDQRSPEEQELGQTLPKDLARGDPKYMHGQTASVTIQSARALYEEEAASGFFSRLRQRPKSEAGKDDTSALQEKPMGKDDIRRLQSTLFELLECKRLLDQARED